MANSLISDIESRLKPGYSLRKATAGFEIVDSKGELVRNEAAQPIKVFAGKGYHYRRRVLGNLQTAGVISNVRTSRSHTSQDFKPVQHTERKTPLVIAAEILRDTKASPRERGLAKALIEAQEATARAANLATFLGERVQELEAFIKDKLPNRG